MSRSNDLRSRRARATAPDSNRVALRLGQLPLEGNTVHLAARLVELVVVVRRRRR